MDTGTLIIGISAAERDGWIVAHFEGATFTGENMWKLAPDRKTYVITFFGHVAADDETATIYAVDDATAEEFARAKWDPPFQITERITTWREVASIDS